MHSQKCSGTSFATPNFKMVPLILRNTYVLWRSFFCFLRACSLKKLPGSSGWRAYVGFRLCPHPRGYVEIYRGCNGFRVYGGYTGVTTGLGGMGLYRDNGKENGSYSLGFGVIRDPIESTLLLFRA